MAQADDTVEALRELVRIPSVTGDEAAAQEVMRRLMVECGLDVDVYTPTRADVVDHPSFSDDGLPLGDRAVVVGRTGPSGPTVVLNGHIDVVPAGDERRWRDDPWRRTTATHGSFIPSPRRARRSLRSASAR